MPPFKHPRLGEVRPSQVVFTYGVGALVDLPHLSALVMGLDDWTVDGGVARPIDEERLLRTVRWQLGSQVQKLLSPPAIPQSAGQVDPFGELARIGVPVALFPRWLFCPKCQRLAPLSSGLFERRDDAYHPERTHYVHSNCDKEKQPVVVPARFLVACEQGHLDDFPWVAFAHRGPTTCSTLLRLIEYGPSGEARDLEVRCDACDTPPRRLSEAFGEEGRARMPQCRGRRPHLRDFAEQPCDQQVKTILLGASNLWFADSVTALAIPTESSKLAQLIEEKWATLQQFPNEQFLTLMRQMTPNPLGDFVGYSDAAIWQAIEKRRIQQQAGVKDDPSDLKQPEWDKLSHPESHTPAKDFRLRAVAAPKGFEALLARVVLVERLREVRALLGFTRIDAPGELGAGPDAGESRRMPLARQAPAWVPAAEVRGEGIFVQFNEAKLAAWLTTNAAKQREHQFLESHMRWRQARKLWPLEGNFPGLRCVLLHSFAHALMRQFVLECGYTAASLRERIYARYPNESPSQPAPMAGVLIYTAAPDSEGTLGGLVSLGEPAQLRRHLLAALRDAAQCASDPLCAEHEPSQRGTTVHAAACHACLFAPETSCERGNKYLDRSVLVSTIEREDLAFFPSVNG
jgi:hypothetical protein